MGVGLVPEYDRRDIILQWQIAATASPPERLDGYLQILLEPDGIGDMPSIESEALRCIIQSIATDHLVEPTIWSREFGVPAYHCTRIILLTRLEIIGAAEIVFGSGSTDGRIPGISIHEEFDLPLAPPAVIIDLSGSGLVRRNCA